MNNVEAIILASIIAVSIILIENVIFNKNTNKNNNYNIIPKSCNSCNINKPNTTNKNMILSNSEDQSFISKENFTSMPSEMELITIEPVSIESVSVENSTDNDFIQSLTNNDLINSISNNIELISNIPSVNIPSTNLSEATKQQIIQKQQLLKNQQIMQKQTTDQPQPIDQQQTMNQPQIMQEQEYIRPQMIQQSQIIEQQQQMMLEQQQQMMLEQQQQMMLEQQQKMMLEQQQKMMQEQQQIMMQRENISSQSSMNPMNPMIQQAQIIEQQKIMQEQQTIEQQQKMMQEQQQKMMQEQQQKMMQEQQQKMMQEQQLKMMQQENISSQPPMMQKAPIMNPMMNPIMQQMAKQMIKQQSQMEKTTEIPIYKQAQNELDNNIADDVQNRGGNTYDVNSVEYQQDGIQDEEDDKVLNNNLFRMSVGNRSVVNKFIESGGKYYGDILTRSTNAPSKFQAATNELKYGDFNYIAPLNKGMINPEYTFVSPTNWYPIPPHPPVCVTNKRCTTSPIIMGDGKDYMQFASLEDFDKSRRFTGDMGININYIKNILNNADGY